ncbi:MAG: phosphate ABC transporter permease PstA, partial [Caldimonas sp.]
MNAAATSRSGDDRKADRQRLHSRRKRANAVALTLALAAMAFGLFWLIWILVETVRLGIGGMAWSL